MTLKDKLTKPLYQYSFDGDSDHTYIRFENMDKIVEAQLKIVEECVDKKHKEDIMTAREFIMEGNEGTKFIDVVDNLTEDNILNLMEEYANVKCKKFLNNFIDIPVITFPNKYKFLEDRFTWDNVEEIFKSKNKWRGLSSGDDKTLYIYADEWCTNIWWKENRGSEDVIFDGRELKTEGEFNQVFELLGLKTLLKWE